MRHDPLRVLFVCTHNGARSRIAEEFAKHLAAGRIEAESASFESDKIGPLPVSVMKEAGFDLPIAPPKSVFERYTDRERFDYVITLCDPTGSEQVPVFTASVDALYDATAPRLNWSIPNFRSLSGMEDERKAAARHVRDRIKSEVLEFLDQLDLDSERA